MLERGSISDRAFLWQTPPAAIGRKCACGAFMRVEVESRRRGFDVLLAARNANAARKPHAWPRSSSRKLRVMYSSLSGALQSRILGEFC